MRLTAAFRALIRRRVHYRVTLGGGLFLLALALTGAGAFLSGNNLLFLIFAAMMALLLVSGFLSRLALSGLEIELLLPEHVAARMPAAAKIRIRNLKSITPSFSIELSGQRIALTDTPPILTGPVYFPLIPGRATIEAMVEVVFPRRGRHRENLFRIATRFPFGFLSKSTTVALRRETIVYPSLAPHADLEELLDAVQGQIEAQARGAGREFYSIRPYESLDDVRHLDWKSTAHTGSPQVREFARDEQRGVELLFDRRIHTGQQPAFEQLVQRCAFVAWHLASSTGSGEQSELTFTCESFRSDFRPGGEGVYDILRFLSLVEPVVIPYVRVDDGAAPGTGAPMFDDSPVQVIFSTVPEEHQSAVQADVALVGIAPGRKDIWHS